MEPNWDLMQDQYERFAEQEFLAVPDWKIVAENAETEDVAELFRLLITGQDAKAKAEQILKGVATDQAYFSASKTVESERNNWESSSVFPEMRSL